MNVKWADVKEDYARKDKEIAVLREALEAIHADLLERAGTDHEGYKVVDCGSSVWIQLKAALASKQAG